MGRKTGIKGEKLMSPLRYSPYIVSSFFCIAILLSNMAERITNLLGHSEPLLSMATSEDDEEDDVNGEEVEEENGQCGNDWDHHLLLAGYSDCMTEALRYLVEEERYSPEHPVVEGLRTHLAQQQDRVLLEASRSHHHHHRHAVQLDNSRVTANNNNNNNNQVVEVRNRVAFISDSKCNIRPPAT
ncbi:hypothetical protein C0J52_22165 [Blattella germanica]|nr:hypothetical protein C0J52_22165 [Blattella germanica]